MVLSDQVALLSAGLRHQEDAERLLLVSPDQSWHLAAFAAECARKACLSSEPLRKALAHEHSTDLDRLLELVIGLDPKAMSLGLFGWAPAGSSLAAWKAEHRYDCRGSHSGGASTLVEETRALYDRTLTALWLETAFNPEDL